MTISSHPIARLPKQSKTIKALDGRTIHQDEPLMACDLDGNPLNPNTIAPAFYKIAKRAGLNLRMHDLRHTHATLMLKQGVNIKVVQECLGHEKAQTTVDIYSHVLPGMQEKAASDFDKMASTAGERT